jgi:hypothetical protein
MGTQQKLRTEAHGHGLAIVLSLGSAVYRLPGLDKRKGSRRNIGPGCHLLVVQALSSTYMLPGKECQNSPLFNRTRRVFDFTRPYLPLITTPELQGTCHLRQFTNLQIVPSSPRPSSNPALFAHRNFWIPSLGSARWIIFVGVYTATGWS